MDLITHSPQVSPCASSPASPQSRRSSITSHSDVDDAFRQMPFSSIETSQALSIKSPKSICCVGAGYVGGPTAAVIALHNPSIRVTVVDKDTNRIACWNSRHLPVHEPGLYDVVRSARDGTKATQLVTEDCRGNHANLSARAPNLFFSTKIEETIAEADLIFLAVNTPTKTYGIGAGQATNIAALEGATRTIARSAKPGAVIVEKSTVPCRTAQTVRETLELHRPGVPFEILSNPEFLAEGTAIKDLLHPDRILIGSLATPSGRAAADTLKSVYAAWVDPAKIITTNLWSSELAKLVANAMLAQRISSINAISAICEKTGADVDEVAHVIGQDQRLGSRFLKAGIGFGGSCFKKDILSLIYLSNCLELPEIGEYWMQVLDINDFQRVRFVRRIVHKLNGNLAGKKIAILGYAFKKDTNDTRESPAIDVIKQLLADAPLEIAIFDPQCTPTKVHEELSLFFGKDILQSEGGSVAAYPNACSACEEATAVVILTEWDQFRYPPLPVPKSAFHEGYQKLQTLPLNTEPKPSEGKVLEMRESRRSISLIRGTPTDYFDPLARFEEEPACSADCTDCLRVQKEDRATHESVDWTQIAGLMKRPRWIFDGRGIVDVSAMEELGFRIESIGKTSSSSRLNNFD